MPRLITSPPTYTILVANIEGAGDPSLGINPIKVRTGFIEQYFPEKPVFNGLNDGSLYYRSPDYKAPGVHTMQGKLTSAYAGATGTITVSSNVFTDIATVFIGPYTFTSGVDFVVGAGVNNTATNLAAAIDALPGFSAVAVGAAITVTATPGPNGDNIQLYAAYAGSVRNFTMSGPYLAGGSPSIGAPDIL